MSVVSVALCKSFSNKLSFFLEINGWPHGNLHFPAFIFLFVKDIFICVKVIIVLRPWDIHGRIMYTHVPQQLCPLVDKFEYRRGHSNHVHPKFFFNYFFLKPLKHNTFTILESRQYLLNPWYYLFLSVVTEKIHL